MKWRKEKEKEGGGGIEEGEENEGRAKRQDVQHNNRQRFTHAYFGN